VEAVARRTAWAAATSTCVIAGFVFGEFLRGIRPVDHLVRPLLLTAVVGLLVGLIASAFGQWSIPAAVFISSWAIGPFSEISLVISLGVAGLLVYRLKSGQVLKVDGPVAAAAVVFLIAGVVPVVPMLSISAQAQASDRNDGPPQYAVLLDGYPRADTLAAYGFDITEFVSDLEERGFDVYPNATSTYTYTFQTISEIVGFSVDDSVGVPQRRRIQTQWRLPDGWVTIAPPVGVATFPRETRLNPGGFNAFEMFLAAKSIFGPLTADWVLNGYRAQLARSLNLLETTDARHVFAHLLAPHAPILYKADGSASTAAPCWPRCADVTADTSAKTTAAAKAEATGGYVLWLNDQLLDVIDRILAARPDAEIVLFSDHGGRFDPKDKDEWHHSFLASRTPERPDLFEDADHPGEVLQRLTQPASG